MRLRASTAGSEESFRTSDVALDVQAIALVCFWTSLFGRFLQRDSTLGPLVLGTLRIEQRILASVNLTQDISRACCCCCSRVNVLQISAIAVAELMLADTLRFLTLAAGPMLALAISLATLAKDPKVNVDDDDCVSVLNTSIWQSILFVFEVVLGSDSQLHCFHNSAHPFTALMLMYIVLAVLVLLGTNMLIAIMSKTFDIIYVRSAFAVLVTCLTS